MTPGPLIIGEQTNASGSRAFKAALLADDPDAMLAVAQAQAREGAHLLDLNVAYAGRDEAGDMERAAARLNAQNRLPLMLDSASIPALEAGLKRCAGRAVINSINLEDGGARAETILSLAGTSAPPWSAWPSTSRGWPATAGTRRPCCNGSTTWPSGAGCSPSDLFLDPLTFTLGVRRSRPGRRRRGNPGRPAAAEKKHARRPYPARGEQHLLRPAAGCPAHRQRRLPLPRRPAAAWTPPSSMPAACCR